MKLVHNKRAKYIERKAHQSSSDVLSLEIDSNYSLITEEIDYRRCYVFKEAFKNWRKNSVKVNFNTPLINSKLQCDDI